MGNRADEALGIEVFSKSIQTMSELLRGPAAWVGKGSPSIGAQLVGPTFQQSLSNIHWEAGA